MVRHDMAEVLQSGCEIEIDRDGDCEVVSIGSSKYDGTDWEMGWSCGLCGERNIHNPVEHLMVEHKNEVYEKVIELMKKEMN